MNMHTRSLQPNTPRSNLRAKGAWMLALLAALAALAALLPQRAWAQNTGEFNTCLAAQGTEITFTPPSISFTANRDGLTAVTPATSGWSYEQTFPQFFKSRPTGTPCGINLLKYTLSVSVAVGVKYSDGTGTYQVYKTAVPNLGFIVGLKVDGGAWTPVDTVTTPVVLTPYYSPKKSEISVGMRMRFVVYGQLQSGSYTLGSPSLNVVTIQAATGPGPGVNVQPHHLQGQSTLKILPTPITITARGCTIRESNSRSVVLPRAKPDQFTGVGSTPGISSPSFNFDLDCDPNVRVHAVMSDANDAANRSDHLALAPGSTATGVGVQIFRDGEATPVSFGPDSSLPNTQNQWHIGTTPAGSGGTFINSFRAGYVQTAPTVGVGELQANATITFSYQ